jgi:phospholipid/cholesterol/gamma-HCH transport system substrate-binding protein
MRLVRALALSLVMVLTLGACDFSVYSLPLPGGADVGDHSYTVDIEFRDVLDLVPQSAVKVDEVTVGKVDGVRLEGYTAVVTVRINGDVVLPENSIATIRQTSLLGEKFVDLAPPTTEQPAGRLANGDTIPLSRSGRNPDVEEVLGALSLLLNGGGVAQLKTIAAELNKALDGREPQVRSVLTQLDTFMGQLDQNKADIISAIRSVDKLTVAVKKQQTTIVNTLDQLPEALHVLDQQRSGLVKMLKGLDRLSPVAVRVIRASKQDTLANLRALDPILTQLARAGDAIPKSLQVFLTYPFVDATVGTTPTEARNLHQGDYTNLSATLDLDLNSLPGLPGVPNVCDQAPQLPVCPTLPTLPSVSVPSLPTLTNPTLTGIPTVLDPVVRCLKDPTVKRCSKPITRFCKNNPLSLKCKDLIKTFCANFPDSQRCQDLASLLCRPLPVGCDGGGGTPTTGSTSGPLDPVCTIAPVLCRPSPGYERDRFNRRGLDQDLALLLLQGVSRP